MFTGLVEEIGRVTAVEPSGDGIRLTIHAPRSVSDAAHGDSIAVSGVCLTVVARDGDGFTADVMRQTLDMSTLADVSVDPVVEVRPGDQWRVIRVAIPQHLAPLVVDKGSIAMDGVSLTVSAVSEPAATEPWFEVSLIPETLEATTFDALEPGAPVNLETDILARHVQRLLAFPPAAAAAPTEGGSL